TSQAGSWQSMIDTNFSGLLNTTHAALPHLAQAAGGPRQVADAVVYILTRPAHLAVNELLLRPLGQLD
ncbi:MAG: hypothetical protein QOG57_7017, partial [Pseudonocardiales bacterium]|nr:hypothetical protein [Pseudonocardiales bacterium]